MPSGSLVVVWLVLHLYTSILICHFLLPIALFDYGWLCYACIVCLVNAHTVLRVVLGVFHWHVINKIYQSKSKVVWSKWKLKNGTRGWPLISIPNYCWLLCNKCSQEVRVYTALWFTSASQVSHTHTGGLAQDKAKKLSPWKSCQTGTQGYCITRSPHCSVRHDWEDPEAWSLCYVWHLVVEISTSGWFTFPSLSHTITASMQSL